MNYIHNKDLGFNRDQVLKVIKNTNVLGNRAKILKDELKQLADVQNATMSSYQPTGDEDLKTGLFPHEKIDIKEDILTEFWSVDEDFINTMEASNWSMGATLLRIWLRILPGSSLTKHS